MRFTPTPTLVVLIHHVLHAHLVVMDQGGGAAPALCDDAVVIDDEGLGKNLMSVDLLAAGLGLGLGSTSINGEHNPGSYSPPDVCFDDLRVLGC